MIRSIPAFLSSMAVMATAAPLPRPSPNFAIHLTPAGQVSPTQYKGKVVVLAFISTTCPHCQHTTQVLSGLQRELGSRGLQVLAAAFNPMANMLVPDFIKQYQPSFPVGYTERADVHGYLDHSEQLQMYVPVLVFIDRRGMIRHQYLGDDPFQQNQEKNLRDTIEAMLKEPAGSKK
ncbi:MAG TPA: TlpA disulfide reductase family protein [Candidatus Solibacter sp.]|nr:TlpA disulfide reductase family protein [Candidatus Solibacter sp.]